MATKAKKSKSSNFFAKLHFHDPKSRLIIFLIVFAVVGGGIMAYRSFAASQSGTKLYASVNLAPARAGDASMIKESSGSKSNTDVWEMTGGSANKFLITKPSFVLPSTAKQVRSCANVRLMAGTGRFVLTHPNGQGFSETINVTNSTTYKVYCTAYRTPTTPLTQERSASVAWGFGNTQKLRVGSIYLEWQ
jgi:hypothetical protein